MASVTSKDLKNKTGQVMKLVESGQDVLITRRGKPFAVLSPVTRDEILSAGLRPYEEAWANLETTLKQTKPKFRTLGKAMKWSRRSR